jgi:hypothetical protein
MLSFSKASRHRRQWSFSESAVKETIGPSKRCKHIPETGCITFVCSSSYATGRSLARFGITGSPDGIRFIGVRVNHGSPEGAAFRPFAGDALRDLRSSSGFSRKSNHWPAYQMAPSPAGEFWEDLSGHRDQLLEIIESAWTKFSGPVDEAVGRWRSTES